jgi:hypothetical protein
MLRLRYWSTPHLTGRLLAAITALLLMASLTMLRLTASAQPTTGQVPGSDPIACPDGSMRRWSIFAGGQVPGRFDGPRDIVLDGDDNLLVVDSGNHRIQKLSPDGSVLATLGGYGEAADQLRDPFSLALDPDGNLYVADSHNRRVQKLAPDGTPLAMWKAPTLPEHNDYEPRQIAAGGHVYASFNGFKAPTQLRRLGTTGNELTTIETPGIRSITDMAVD